MTQLSTLVKELVTNTENQQAPLVFRNLQGFEEELSKYNIIMFGDPEQYAYIEGKWDQLLVQRQDGRLQLAKFQVIPETTTHVAWIQPSIWNEQYWMLVLQHTEGIESGNESHYHPDLLQYIRQDQTDSQIVIRSKGNSIHSVLLDRETRTGAEGFSLEVSGDSAELPIWIFIVLVALFMVILLVLITLWKRKQRDK